MTPSVIRYIIYSYLGLKLIVLGQKSSGKTSLVQSLADGQSRITSPDEATVMCDVSSIDLANLTGESTMYSYILKQTTGTPAFVAYITLNNLII